MAMREGVIRKLIEPQTVDQAVLITSAGLFDGRSRHRSGDSGPLTRVGGMTLFLRAVLTLQRAGIKEAVILTGKEEPILREMVKTDPRVTMALRWRPIREFPPEDVRTWEALGMDIRGGCLLVGGRAIFSRGLVERLRDQARNGDLGLVVCQQDESMTNGALSNPCVKIRGDRAIALHEWVASFQDGGGATQGIVADIMVIPGNLLRTAGMIENIRKSAPLRTIVEQAVSEGHVKAMTLSYPSRSWYQDVLDPSAIQPAEQTLLDAHPGEYEGFIDTYFNRPVSKPFTKLFLKWNLTPNAITLLSMGIGFVAAGCFALGNYTGGVIGALIFQLAAVVDCCDGEVARMTFAESEFGAKLDMIGDNVVHMAIFAGMALGLYFHQGAESWLPLGLGTAAIIGNGLSLVMVTKAQKIRRRMGRRERKAPGMFNFLVKNMASRDFSVVILLLALVGWLEGFLWMTAIGSNIFWVVMAWATKSSSLPRA